MNFHKATFLGIALLAAGVVMIVYGIHASFSFGPGISLFYQGITESHAMWLRLAGVATVVAGSVISLGPARKGPQGSGPK
jgi:uncharacterized protein YjeT (DUF2065 family)